MVGDMRVGGTHSPEPDCSHYRVLRACFITGLGSRGVTGYLAFGVQPLDRQ